MNNRELVDALLVSYDEYKKLLSEKETISFQLAKQKLIGGDSAELTSNLDRLENELQVLSDGMTFANPIVWLTYKYEAYKDESQPIRTIHDLRVHCAKPGYICTKRYAFLNQELQKRGNARLSDGDVYLAGMDLEILLRSETLNGLSQDPHFLKAWDEYEFNKVGERIAKWENFG